MDMKFTTDRWQDVELLWFLASPAERFWMTAGGVMVLAVILFGAFGFLDTVFGDRVSRFLTKRGIANDVLFEDVEPLPAKLLEFQARRAEDVRTVLRDDLERQRRAELVVAACMGTEVRR